MVSLIGPEKRGCTQGGAKKRDDSILNVAEKYHPSIAFHTLREPRIRKKGNCQVFDHQYEILFSN
jgi:hypothetical protein